MPSHSSHLGVALRLSICGVGFGLFQGPNIREIMSKAPISRSGGASAIVAISRLMGQTFGAALVAQCFHLWGVGGPSMALWVGSGCALLGSAISVMRLRGGASPIADSA